MRVIFWVVVVLSSSLALHKYEFFFSSFFRKHEYEATINHLLTFIHSLFMPLLSILFIVKMKLLCWWISWNTPKTLSVFDDPRSLSFFYFICLPFDAFSSRLVGSINFVVWFVGRFSILCFRLLGSCCSLSFNWCFSISVKSFSSFEAPPVTNYVHSIILL
jgi:hypothetical protein